MLRKAVNLFLAFALGSLFLVATSETSEATSSPTVSAAVTTVRVGSTTNLNLSIANFDSTKSFQVTVKLVDANNVDVTNGTIEATKFGTSTNISGYNAVNGSGKFSGAKIGFKGTYSEIVQSLATVTWNANSAANVKMRVAIATAPGTNEFYDGNTGNYYRYVSTATTWTTAATNANSATLYGLQGYLANITTKAENEFIAGETSAPSIWFGLSDRDSEGQWRYSSGPSNENFVLNTFSPYDNSSSTHMSSASGFELNSWYSGAYAGWASGEPNNWGGNEDCAVTNWSGGAGRWNDLSCSTSAAYLIEFGGRSGDSFTGQRASVDLNLSATVSALKPSNSVIPSINSVTAIGSTVTASDGTWSDNGASITSTTYKWQYGDGLGAWSDVPTADGTVITNQTLVIPRSIAGYKIRVLVSKTNSVGTSDPTASQASANVITGVPLAPTLTSVTPSSGSLNVALTHGNNGGSSISAIKYQLSADGTNWNSAVTVNSASSPFTISGLTNGTLYYVRALSVNGVGDSQYSNSLSATVGQVPDPPTNLIVVADGDRFTLRFTGSTTYGSAVTSYQYSTDGGSTWKALSGTTSPQYITTASDDSSLTSDTSYDVRMRAVSAIGNSSSTSSLPSTFRSESTFSTSNFVLGGTSGNPASYDSATGAYVLTQAANNRYGTVWSTSRLDLREDFVINASVYLGNSDAGADGMAFVIQPASTNSGSSGGGLGYLGINNSFAVEFDTYFNSPGDSTSSDHITYIANGAAGSESAHTAYVTPYTTELEDGTWRDVRFTWIASSKTLITEFETVSDGSLVQILSTSNLNLTSSGLINSNFAYWGFTAATGGAVNKQQVKINSFTVSNRPNNSPTLNAISDLTISSARNSNSVALTFADDSSTQAQFTILGTSSNQSIVANADIIETVSSTTAGTLAITPKGVSGSTTITVKITDADGAYATKTFVLTVFGPPSVPRNVSTSLSGTTATISWLAPESNGGSAISRYVAYATPPTGSALSCNTTSSGAEPPARSCEILGLTEGVRYTVTVVAENSALSGLPAQTSAASSGISLAATKVNVPGNIPSRISPVAPPKFVGNVTEATKQTLVSAGVVVPPTGAPKISVSSDLRNTSIDVPTSVTLSETVTSGSEIVLEVVPPSNTPIGTVFRGYLELTDGTLVDLGNFTLTANQITQGAGPDGFTIVPIGNYKVYLYVGDRIQQAGFQEGAGTFSSNSTLQVQPALFFGNAVNKTPGQVEVTYDLTVAAGPNGVPQLANPPAPAPAPSTSTTPTPSPTPSRSSSSTPSPEPTTAAPTSEPTPEASTLAEATPEPSVDERGLEVVDPVADAPAEVAQTTVTAVTLVAAVTAAASAAAAVAGAAGAAAGAAGAAAGGSAGSTGGGSAGRSGGGASGSSSSSSSSSGSSGGGEGEGEDDASLEGIDFEHEGFEIDRDAWGDNLKAWSIPFLRILDQPSHNATEILAPISPLVSKLISDGAYLRAIFGTIAAILPALGIALGLIGVQQTGGLLVPPPAWIVAAIACIGIFDALAGFLGMFVFSVGMSITVGLTSAADIRMMLGLFIIGFGPALLAGAFRGLRKPPADNFAEWWERFTDLAIAPFLGAWATKGMVEALPALAGVKLPIAESANTIAWIVAFSLVTRVLLEEFTSRFFPSRLNFIHPTDVPSPSNLQKSIALAMRAFIFWFVAGAFIGTTWHLYVGTALFIAPSYLGLFQDKFPNYPKLYQILPAGLPGLAFTLLVASYSLAGLTAILGETPDLAKMAFVLLPIPSVILSVLGMLGREPADGDVRWYQREQVTWLYRIGGIAVFIYTLQLTGII